MSAFSRALRAPSDLPLLAGLVLAKALFVVLAARAPAAAWGRAVAGAPSDPAASGLPDLDLWAQAAAAGAGPTGAWDAAAAPLLLYAILFGVFSGGVWARLAGGSEGFGAATARLAPAFAGVFAVEAAALAGVAAAHAGLEEPAARLLADTKSVWLGVAPEVARHAGAAGAFALVSLLGGIARARCAVRGESLRHALLGAPGTLARRAGSLAAVAAVSLAGLAGSALAFWLFAASPAALGAGLGGLALGLLVVAQVASRLVLWGGEVAAVATEAAAPGRG